MASPKWLGVIKAKLALNPLYWVGDTHYVMCKLCGGHGKKVPLYRITNYHEFKTCCKCGAKYDY